MDTLSGARKRQRGWRGGNYISGRQRFSGKTEVPEIAARSRYKLWLQQSCFFNLDKYRLWPSILLPNNNSPHFIISWAAATSKYYRKPKSSLSQKFQSRRDRILRRKGTRKRVNFRGNFFPGEKAAWKTSVSDGCKWGQCREAWDK